MTKEKVDQIEETTELEEVTIPEYSLIDVMRELKRTQNMLNELEQKLDVTVEAVKALGKNVIDSNCGTQAALTDLAVKMSDLQGAFIKTVAQPPQKNPFKRVEPEVTKSQFDPADLMQHSWKGKKIGHKEWEQGSLSFGWDFKNEFHPDTIAALEGGKLEIDQYEFKLDGKLVSTKKLK